MGLGYVGLPTALAFHAVGQSVRGLELSQHRIESIRQRTVDLVSRDQERLARALGDERFLLTDNPAELSSASAVII